MAYAMTKQGSLDNCITYEFICDTLNDMNAIENRYRTLGSIAIVLRGDSEGLEVYIANSSKEWVQLNISNNSEEGNYNYNDENNTTGSGLSLHICSSAEVRSGKPKITDPDPNTIYLVGNVNDTNNLYTEFIYVNNKWEKFGEGKNEIDLSDYITTTDIETIVEELSDSFVSIEDPDFDGTISLGREGSAGLYSSAIGTGVTASGYASHAEGFYTTASAYYSHAENYSTTASGTASHAENYSTTASGDKSHAEGFYTTASGGTSHAEGTQTVASGISSHAEGRETRAKGESSHAEGEDTTAAGSYQHVVGKNNIADSFESWPEWDAQTQYYRGDKIKKTTVEGNTTTVKGYVAQHNAMGTFRASDWREAPEMTYVEIVGNGIVDPSNARALDWNGNEYLMGTLYTNCDKNGKNGSQVITEICDNVKIKKWIGVNYIDGRYVWTDGENIYYSHYISGSDTNHQYILDKATSTWSTKTWAGDVLNPEGNSIYKFNNNIYYQFGSNPPMTYVLDKSTSTWTNIISNLQYWNIWSDGENYYYSNDTTQYIWDSSTSTWETKTWNNYQPSFGMYIWMDDNNNIYYSGGTGSQYVLNKATNTWELKTWNGLTDIYGTNIWKYKDNIYYSSTVNSYVLDKSTSTWIPKIWSKPLGRREDFWTDGENVYYNSNGKSYIIDDETKLLIGKDGKFEEKPIDNIFNTYAPMSDWNQTDSNAADYIKNRPFGYTGAPVIYLPETEVTLTSNGLGYVGNSNLALTLNQAVELNEIYAIIINSTRYSIACGSIQYNSFDHTTYFNLYGGDNGNYINVSGKCLTDSTTNEQIYQIYSVSASFLEEGNYTIQLIKQPMSKLTAEWLDTDSLGFVHANNPVVYDSISMGREGNTGLYSAALGQAVTATGEGSFAEGGWTTASGYQSHAEGYQTTASGYYAHAEGYQSTASGNHSHAENNSEAIGITSHAEGTGTAQGELSHAEGQGTVAAGNISHASGYYTEARGTHETVVGQYNSLTTVPTWTAGTSYQQGDLVQRTDNKNITTIYRCRNANSNSSFTSSNWQKDHAHLFVVGNGVDENNRSNACAIDGNGNEYLKGDLYVGANANSSGGTKLARIPDPPSTNGVYTLQATVSNGVVTYTWVAGA